MGSGWRRVVRVALIAVVAAVGAAVYFGLRDRAEPAQAVTVAPIDPDAVMETRGSRIVQADAVGENLEVVSGRQITYADGAMRLLDGVDITVADREDRPGFHLTGEEATLDDDQTHVHIVGGVRMASSDGLTAETDVADYADTEGVVRMPGPTRIAREGMTASGDGAEYERASDILYLLSAARVELTDGASETRVDARTAVLAQRDGYMRFEGDVQIRRGEHVMRADRARATTPVDSSIIQSLDLAGGAEIVGEVQRSGALRRMSAGEITLIYGAAGGTVERATLGGDAALELFGRDGEDGTLIEGRVLDVRFDPEGRELEELVATNDVRLTAPGGEGRPHQQVRAATLTMTGVPAADAEPRAAFDGGVEYRESVAGNEEDEARVTRADRLDAALGEYVSGLETARFVGNVVLEDRDALGYADEAGYSVATGLLELMTTGSDGQTPRLEQARRGSIQAQSIAFGLENGRIEATNQVESVLTGGSDEASADVKRPGMLDDGEPVYVTSAGLVYDDDAATTTYTGGARLWQTTARFEGEQIVLDELEGDIRATGQVRTAWLIAQVDDETGDVESSMSRGRGAEFHYDDEADVATYTGDAGLVGPRGDLRAGTIRMFLQPDGRTLDRIEADGDVRLVTSTRWLSGDRLVYHDADGRYEMDGAPVRIIERAEPECRETTGRRLTFFLTEDAVSVDGASQVRTEAASVRCPVGTVG